MPKMSDTLLYPELSFLVCGLCFNVHNELGRYRSEKQYADLLEVKFKENGVKYEREQFLAPSFPGEGKRNKPDFLVEDRLVLDLKAKSIITKDDYFQMKRYLDSAKKQLGIIVNFRQLYLRPKRVIRGKDS
ncbi:MAG: GxxExxY protein [bacterium]|nr:GxxExxY protein [bacterium]